MIGNRFAVVAALTLSCLACAPDAPDRVVTTSPNTEVVTPKVVWPSTARDERAFAALGEPKHALELLARSPVPVLAPTHVALERPTFVVGAEYFALTGRISGATIAIQGTRARHRYDTVQPVSGDRVLRGVPGFVSSNEGIRTTAWTENGASYSVDVECAERNDTRCASEAFVLDFVEKLGLAGGGSR